MEATAQEKVQVGDDMRVRAWVNLGDLSPDDVSVQIYHGLVDTHGNIAEGKIIPMHTGETKGSTILFSGAIRYFKSGRHGFTVRVIPHHDDQSSPYETALVHWATQQVNVTA